MEEVRTFTDAELDLLRHGGIPHIASNSDSPESGNQHPAAQGST
eukprot:CAMPEP_0198115944 /NCGR_PEP_ID=MMETSP1442-20131203/8441_1 /TAXON_ID= /ORGANISM="Craspedostauros australis, Strain CCMP3328" /LENGTH=43 /DNA_ID= /DNA_START= /DNA_END= /DNA_ORIENTATION=